MRLVFMFVLLLGLGLAGFAVYMAQDYIAQNEAQLAKERAARAQIVENPYLNGTTIRLDGAVRLPQR